MSGGRAAAVAVVSAAWGVIAAVRPQPARAALRRLGRASARAAPTGRRAAGSSRASAVAPGPPGTVPVEAVLELVASVLDGGAPVDRAVTAVADALRFAGDASGEPLRAVAASGPSGSAAAAVAGSGAEAAAGSAAAAVAGSGAAAELSAVLGLAMATGCAPAALLRSAAAARRRRRAAEQARRARRLGVLVLLPTGLCLLPAFVLLTVVPLVLDLLSQALR